LLGRFTPNDDKNEAWWVLLAQHKNYADAQAALAQSFVDLDVDYIDLMLIHAPQPWTDFRESNHYFEGNLAAWQAMEELYHAGKIRAIGVSNFEEADLQNLLDHAEVPPMVDQILAHISNMPFALIDFCRAHRIAVEAYSPLGHGVMLRNPDTPYQGGRSSDLLKLKSAHDAECVVTQHHEGKGKYAGMLGALSCKNQLGEFRIGSGFKDAQRKNPPKIGSTITYKYRGFTHKGTPRFATFLRARTDK